MLLYNFHRKIIDLSTFIIIDSFDGNVPLLNKFDNFYTYSDIQNYLNNDEYYSKIQHHFKIIDKFLQHPFFKIYSKIDDLEIFKKLFIDIVNNSDFISAHKSASEINNIVLNTSAKSFLKYNLTFRNNFDNLSYINTIKYDKKYFNFKENFSTFRISNSFTSMSNEEFFNQIYVPKSNKKLMEFDVKASDWLWIMFMNYLLTKNKSVASKVISYGVYDLLDLKNKTYKEEKLSMLTSMYSINREDNLTDMQKYIIEKFDIKQFIEYIVNNKSVVLPNGFIRTSKYAVALYGQTMTSIFVMRFILNEFKKYMDNVGGTIIFTKHDSILFEVDRKFEFTKHFKPSIIGYNINYCNKNFTFSETDEKILQIFLENNHKIKEIK